MKFKQAIKRIATEDLSRIAQLISLAAWSSNGQVLSEWHAEELRHADELRNAINAELESRPQEAS
jgi:hypothetical protein